MALYPPIVASSMPAFDKNQTEVRIYFSLSDYNSNSMQDIKKVHVSVRFQNNNVNALTDTAALIIAVNPLYDEVLNKYYVSLSQSNFNQEKCISGNAFIPDKLYKVQLRFSSVETNEYTTSWFTNNINNFSLWSTVCIIKPITPPLFYIADFDRQQTGKDSGVDDENNFSSLFADFLITYKQLKSTEVLNSWRLRLLDPAFTRDDIANIKDYTLSDSKLQIVSATNYNLNSNNLVIESYLPYILEENHDYKLYLLIFTKNDYSKGILYNFTYMPQNINEIEDGVLSTFVNEEEGYIKLTLTSSENSKLTNMVIRRTDSKSNFTIWEDLKNFTTSGELGFTYYDFTAESGIAYRYLVQKKDSRGRRGIPTYDDSYHSNKGIIAEWLNAFLLLATGNGASDKLNEVTQLKLKYDFQISSYKTNISESKTDTIGSKYPFIRRNGNMYYRSFPITGTITAYMDEARLFSSENKIYNNKNEIYKLYRGLLDSIREYATVYDYTTERLFREKVLEFLYNSKPKLYKSMQEGNIFVKLMEVSLTPKNELGRLIYSFSATAYEIDLACILTYSKYGLINVGQYNPNLSDTKTIMAQLTSYQIGSDLVQSFPANLDILKSNNSSVNTIAKKIKYGLSYNDQIVSDFKLNWLRITVESDPYLIGLFVDSAGNVYYEPIDDNNKDDNPSNNGYRITQDVDYPLYQIEATYHMKSEDGNSKYPQNIYLGTLFLINGEPIIISPPNNIYLVKDDNFIFESIIPKKDTVMSIDYRVDMKIVEDISKIPKSREFERVNGQLAKRFDPSEQLISIIKDKYRYSYQDSTVVQGAEKVQKYVQAVHSILVDSLPGTVVKLKTSADENNEYRFVINETGLLNFELPVSTMSITSLKIAGINRIYKNKDMIKKNNNNLPLSRQEIEYPYNGQVCQEGNKYYYYNRKWFPCTVVVDNLDSNEANKAFSIDVSCPVESLVFYYITVGRDYY